MTHHAGQIDIHIGDALLLRRALRSVREHNEHGRERLSDVQLYRLSVIVSRVEAVEDEFALGRDPDHRPTASDIWGVAY